jgi:hypothetical protein
MSDARDVVNACYAALAEGDLARSRAFWSDDAVPGEGGGDLAY